MSEAAALAPGVDRFVEWEEDDVPSRSPPEHEGLALLAELCDQASGPNRDLDARIALAIFPPMRSLQVLSTGVWAHPDGSRVRALRYSSSSVAAMTLVPDGHWIECSADVVGRIEVHGPRQADAVGWGRNDHFPLAALAAALRAKAALARSPSNDPRSVGVQPSDGPSPGTVLARRRARIDRDKLIVSPSSARRAPFDLALSVWTVLLAVWIAFFCLFWFFSPRNEASALVVTGSVLFGLLAFGLPIVLDRWTTGIRMNSPEKSDARPGSLRAWASAVQVVLIPVTMVACLAVFMLFMV